MQGREGSGRPLCVSRATKGLSAGIVIAGATLLGLSGLAGAAPSLRGGQSRPRVSCEAHGPVGVHHNSWSAATRTMAPQGAQMINLCRYAGSDSHPRYKLVGSELVTSHRVTHQITTRLDALKPDGRFGGHPPGCPKSLGQEVVATLLYRAHTVRVALDLAGCTYARNGDITLPTYNTRAGGRLKTQLERLTSR